MSKHSIRRKQQDRPRNRLNSSFKQTLKFIPKCDVALTFELLDRTLYQMYLNNNPKFVHDKYDSQHHNQMAFMVVSNSSSHR